MLRFRRITILFSLTLYFLVSTEAQKHSRNAGYFYDKPDNTLDISKDEESEQEVTTEEINSIRNITDRPYEEYLPPKTGSTSNHSVGENERFSRLNQEKTDLHTTKKKSVRQPQISVQNLRSGGFKQKNGFRFENMQE